MYELAIDEHGDPIDVTSDVTGWRVRRAKDGPGRPRLVRMRGSDRRNGPQLVLPLAATTSDLLREAGPGRYWLDPVDGAQRRVDGVRTASVDLLDDDEPTEALDERDGSSVLARVLERTVAANTRMAQDAVGQAAVMMGQTAQLLHAAHSVGLSMRPAVVVADGEFADGEFADGDDEDSAAAEVSRPPGIHPLFEYLIDKVVNAAVPAVVGRLAHSGVGVPPEALVDWRLAKPASTAPGRSPATVHQPPYAAASSPERAPTEPQATVDTLGVSGGTASTYEAVPPASSPALDVNAHVLAVWQALTDEERAGASVLVAHLTPDERTAWITELAGLTVADATARVRSILASLRSDSALAAVPTLPTTT